MASDQSTLARWNSRASGAAIVCVQRPELTTIAKPPRELTVSINTAEFLAVIMALHVPDPDSNLLIKPDSPLVRLPPASVTTKLV